jgi:GNAT superfamily N-acetyltransferase
MLVAPVSAGDWAAYHDIRRRVLFEARGRFGVYDPGHPDDRKPANFPMILVQGASYLGVVRIDCAGEVCHLRRVAIDIPHQRQGYGRRLITLAEEFAQKRGAARVESAVAPDATVFYRKCGYSPTSKRQGLSVPMYKDLAAPGPRPR